MLHPAIVASDKDVIHGRGLVATALIRCGEIVWTLDPDDVRIPCAEVATWPDEEQARFRLVAYQCDATHYAVCDDIDRYMNHSCDPNTWWSGSDTLVACRDILSGEEVTCDYATFEITVPFTMACSCGAACCRGTVTHLDYRNEQWQRRYGVHLPAHVRQAIAELMTCDRMVQHGKKD